MSVLIKDMGKPKSCYAVIDGEYEYCPFVNTDDDCVLLLKKGTCEGTWEGQYSKCPLIEAPELCEDAVSRQAAIDALDKRFDKIPMEQTAEILKLRKDLRGLPSIKLEQKRGRWIYGEDEYGIDGYHCDKCGFFVPCDYAHKFINYIEDYKFCPNCGADMRGEQNG